MKRGKVEKEKEKEEYQKPELIQHENLNEVTKGAIRGSVPF